MSKYFNPTPKTVEQLKKMYKKLAMQYHPDLGGSTEVMQQVNNEYDTLFARLKNVHETATGEVYTAEDKTAEMPETFRNIINKIIGLDGISIELIGTWIWVTGNTYKSKEVLKAAGFKWVNSKKAWTWHHEGIGKTSKKKFSLDDIRMMYGTAEIKTQSRMRLATA